MQIIEKHHRHFEYAGIAMNLFIAFQYFMLWCLPKMTDASILVTMGGLILFEFLLVHSGVFMAIMPKKISLFVFVPFYGIFAYGLNFAVEDNVILFAYLLVVINRMRYAFSDVPDEIRVKVIRKSFASAKWYILLLLPICFFAEVVPELGLTSEFLSLSGYTSLQEGKGGMFIEMPHIPMFFGFLYYLTMALVEYNLIQDSPQTAEVSSAVENQVGSR